MTEVEIHIKTQAETISVDKLLEGLDIKGKATIKTYFGTYTLPIPNTKSISHFNRVLQGSAARAFERLLAAHALMLNKQLDLDKLSKDLKSNAERAVGKIRTSEVKKEVLRDILFIYMLESMSDNYLSRMNREYGKASVWKDPVSEGLMVINPPDDHPCRTAARIRKVSPKYLLDDNQTQLLKAMAFSSNPRERAGAKLTLNAKLPRNTMNDISKNPRRVLAYVLSEAELTTEEVVATIFTGRKTDETRCPTCDTDIGIIGNIYHGRCDVVNWLEKYFFFSYNDDKGLLTQVHKRQYTLIIIRELFSN